MQLRQAIDSSSEARNRGAPNWYILKCDIIGLGINIYQGGSFWKLPLQLSGLTLKTYLNVSTGKLNQVVQNL